MTMDYARLLKEASQRVSQQSMGQQNMGLVAMQGLGQAGCLNQLVPSLPKTLDAQYEYLKGVLSDAQHTLAEVERQNVVLAAKVKDLEERLASLRKRTGERDASVHNAIRNRV